MSARYEGPFSSSVKHLLDSADVHLLFWKEDSRWTSLLLLSEKQKYAGRIIAENAGELHAALGFADSENAHGLFKPLKEALETLSIGEIRSDVWRTALNQFSDTADQIFNIAEASESETMKEIREAAKIYTEIADSEEMASLLKARNSALTGFLVALRDCNTALEEAGFPYADSFEDKVLLNFAEPEKTFLGKALPGVRSSAESSPPEKDESETWSSLLCRICKLCLEADKLYAPMPKS